VGRHREWWGGKRGHGQGQGVVRRRKGPWTGSRSGGEAYGAIGRHREWWGGIRGLGQAQGVVGE